MSFEKALQALKNRDFSGARELMAYEPASGFGVQQFQVKGLSELALEDWKAASKTFAEATRRFPSEAMFWLNRGTAEENLGMVDAAISSFQNCLILDSKQGEAAGNLSNLLRKQKKFAEAEALARRAIENGANISGSQNALGLALSRQGKFNDASRAFLVAHNAEPQNPDVIANQANLAVDELKFDEAWPLFAKARAIIDKAVYRKDEAMARMLAGDYTQGLPLYEARLEMAGALRIKPPYPIWRGENLKGKKILLLAEQGYGDVIQFCRYADLLEGAELIWVLPNPLLRLMAANVRGMVVSEIDPLPFCDYYAPIMSLPLLTGGAVRGGTSHMRAAGEPVLPASKHKKKIGLVWAGSKTHERDHERSIKLSQLAYLLENTDADFYAPFVGEGLNELTNLPIIRLDDRIKDFADTAALLKQLDCLITVDTATAHLAGALGVKTYLLLPYCPDWRWGTSGETTAWYSSVTLLRQSAYGDWSAPFNRISSLLKINKSSTEF